ncbi:MAG TPA: condensation domain-containing protein, partial [Blastocatellia bacterium]
DRLNPFNANNPDQPLFRFKLFVRSDESFQFFMSTHHAICDGWGNIEFLKELFQSYIDIKNGNAEEPLPAPNTYKEFVALEQEILASREAAEFWESHLKNESHSALPTVDTGTDDAFKPEVSVYLDPELGSELQALAQKSRVSLKTVYLSAYLDLIGRMTRQSVATAGVISNGRSERLTDPLKALGLFWNIVPFCAPVDYQDKLAQLTKVQQLLIDVEGFASYPLPQILENQGKSELFFASFNFLNFHNAREFSTDATVEVIGSGNCDRFSFPLNLRVAVSPFDGQVNLNVGYDNHYFTERSIHSIIDSYTELLQSLTPGRIQ